MRVDLLSPATACRFAVAGLAGRTDPLAVVARLVCVTAELVEQAEVSVAGYAADAADIAAAARLGLTVQQYRDALDEVLADNELSVG